MEKTHKLILPNAELLGEVVRLLAAGKEVILSTKGASMMPFIHTNRDSVMLVRRDRLQVGDIALGEIARGRYVLHRIAAIDGEKVTLRGDGNLRGTERCRLDHIYGVATQIIRPDGKTIDAESPRFKRRARRWNALPVPVRHVFLALYRRMLGIPRNINQIQE
ncbi:MAG: S24/S26 family peptidase [Bacteroidales bacterium]|nr:S24/S26 family peptidase [Bacteroidales bacterium]